MEHGRAATNVLMRWQPTQRSPGQSGENMTATQDDMIAELQRANAKPRRELSERDAALAQRNSEYGERIAHQSATIDLLKAALWWSSRLGAVSDLSDEPQPVLQRQRKSCPRARSVAARV
jgi:hypothetical protein